MTFTARRIGLTLLAALVAVATVVAGGTAARADTAPPWGSDGNSVGDLQFFDASGNPITGGSVDDTPIAAYVEGTVAPRAGDTRATLFGYLPVAGEDPGQWSGEQLGSSTAYPDAAAPGALGTATQPFETGHSGDVSVAQLEATYPQTGTGAYTGLYQLRLVTSAPGLSRTPTYDSAVIQVTGTTWQVYSGSSTQPTATTTTLAVSPHGTVFHGTSIVLQATVSPAGATGTVKFLDGSSTIGTASVSGGTARLTTKALKDGRHSLSATFVPATSGYSGSHSSSTTLVVTPHPTGTTLAASKKTLHRGQAETLTAKVAPSAAAGSVEFLDGGKKLGTVKVSAGKARLVTKKLGKGKHRLAAKFLPKNTQSYRGSTSRPVTVTVKP